MCLLITEKNVDNTYFSKTFLSNHFTAVCDRKDALTSVLENLDMYRKRAEEASKSRANIIVFPEVSYDIKHQNDMSNNKSRNV